MRVRIATLARARQQDPRELRAILEREGAYVELDAAGEPVVDGTDARLSLEGQPQQHYGPQGRRGITPREAVERVRALYGGSPHGDLQGQPRDLEKEEQRLPRARRAVRQWVKNSGRESLHPHIDRSKREARENEEELEWQRLNARELEPEPEPKPEPRPRKVSAKEAQRHALLSEFTAAMESLSPADRAKAMRRLMEGD